jgi:hypothetical protein
MVTEMLDEKDLQAIAHLMDTKISSAMDGLGKRIDVKLEQQKNDLLEVMQQQMDTMTGMIKDAETRINIKIENDVGKRIDSLFDGYKLAHEKQWELEHKMEELERRLERLENRAG